MSFYREQLEDWLAKLDVNALSVFDIGGGQNNVKGRTKSWDVIDYQVLDLPEFDLEHPMAHDGLYEANAIFCLEVFEYLIYPGVALRNIKKMLAAGGRAYITFQFVYPRHNELERDSLRYTESGIRRLAQASGLEIEAIDYRVDKSSLLTSFYATDGMRAAKGVDHSVTGYIVTLVKP